MRKNVYIIFLINNRIQKLNRAIKQLYGKYKMSINDFVKIILYQNKYINMINI